MDTQRALQNLKTKLAFDHLLLTDDLAPLIDSAVPKNAYNFTDAFETLGASTSDDAAAAKRAASIAYLHGVYIMWRRWVMSNIGLIGGGGVTTGQPEALAELEQLRLSETFSKFDLISHCCGHILYGEVAKDLPIVTIDGKSKSIIELMKEYTFSDAYYDSSILDEMRIDVVEEAKATYYFVVADDATAAATTATTTTTTTANTAPPCSEGVVHNNNNERNNDDDKFCADKMWVYVGVGGAVLLLLVLLRLRQ